MIQSRPVRMLLLVLLACCVSDSARAAGQEVANGPSPRASAMADAGLARLGRPYAANTLIGSATRPEQLVCREDSLDCMTFLEICAAATADTGFCEGLQAWRYADARVDWSKRLHFFSDWAVAHPELEDISARLPGAQVRNKVLNQKSDGSQWLPGLGTQERTLTRVPPSAALLDSLRTGDLVGFWSDAAGLDVSHTGMIVRQNGKVLLLHASSLKQRVILEPIVAHAKWKNGLIVQRIR